MPRFPSLHDDAVRARGRRHLRRDPILSGLIPRLGDIWPRRRTTAFGSLVGTIVGQQISTAAARTIHRRLRERFGRNLRPGPLRSASDEEFRACGLSRQKVRYLRDLCAHVEEGSLVLRQLPWLPDDDVAAQLTQVMGLGPWSAEMHLLFALGRTDVLATGDLGLQNAARDLYGLGDRPDPERFRALAEPWRPYRGLASAYLWASLDNGTWAKR